VNAVFGAGSPNANSALGKLSNMQKQLDKGDIVDGQAQAKNLIGFIQQKASTLPGASQAQTLINQLECYAGIAANTFLIFPSDQPQSVINSTGQAGLSLPGNPVSEPTLVTITTLGTSPLNTQLDVYPGYIEITQQSGVTNSFIQPVTVAVCPAPGIDPVILGRLRLGHQSSVNGFEITPAAPADFLTCSGSISIGSAKGRLPGWIRSLASLVLPKPLYAKMRFAGGVGGLASEFSPFGPVDPVLSATGGVGGLASEFLRAPTTADTAASTGGKRVPRNPRNLETLGSPARPDAPSASTKPASLGSGLGRRADATIVSCSAVVDQSLTPECRPRVTVKTALGHVIADAAIVTWNAHNGGLVARDSGSALSYACGTFGSSATSPTNANGVAGACWTMGHIAGPDTLIATPAPTSVLPPGVTFSPAADTFTVYADKASQSITFAPLAPLTWAPGTTIPVSATASSGLTVAFAVGSGDNCTIAGTTVTITGAGSCTVTASQAGDGTYGAATPVSRTFAIGLASQTIGFGGLSSKIFGDADFTVGATATSGLAVSFGATGSCTVSGTTVHITGAGDCTVTASQAGDANYSAAPDVPQAFSIATAGQTITFGGLADKTWGDGDVTVSATASSSLAVTFGATGSCTVSGATVHITGAGTCTVTASQAGNVNFKAATPVDQPFTIGQASQTIGFGGLADKTWGAGDFTVGATATSGLAVSFGAAGSCTVSGATVHITGIGTCGVTASQGGNTNYSASLSVTRNFTIAPAPSAISWANPADIKLGTPLSSTQLNATSPTTTGTFVYTPPAGTVLGKGKTTLNVAFTPSSANYSSAAGSVDIWVRYVQSGCFAAPVYSAPPPTTKYVKLGSNVPVKCQLLTVSGSAVQNAHGNLKVQVSDASGNTNGAQVFLATDVFKLDQNKNYNYGFDTSILANATYYFLTAFWDDGSITKGWIYIK
jgi:hypothetical protein